MFNSIKPISDFTNDYFNQSNQWLSNHWSEVSIALTGSEANPTTSFDPTTVVDTLAEWQTTASDFFHDVTTSTDTTTTEPATEQFTGFQTLLTNQVTDWQADFSHLFDNPTANDSSSGDPLPDWQTLLSELPDDLLPNHLTENLWQQTNGMEPTNPTDSSANLQQVADWFSDHVADLPVNHLSAEGSTPTTSANFADLGTTLHDLVDQAANNLSNTATDSSPLTESVNIKDVLNLSSTHPEDGLLNQVFGEQQPLSAISILNNSGDSAGGQSGGSADFNLGSVFDSLHIDWQSSHLT